MSTRHIPLSPDASYLAHTNTDTLLKECPDGSQPAIRGSQKEPVTLYDSLCRKCQRFFPMEISMCPQCNSLTECAEYRRILLRTRILRALREKLERIQRRDLLVRLVYEQNATKANTDDDTPLKVLAQGYRPWDFWEVLSDDEEVQPGVTTDPAVRALDAALRARREAKARALAAATALKESGNTLFRTGDFASAAEHYTAGLRACADEKSLYANRALCWLRLGQWHEAERDCTAALRLWWHVDGRRALRRDVVLNARGNSGASHTHVVSQPTPAAASKGCVAPPDLQTVVMEATTASENVHAVPSSATTEAAAAAPVPWAAAKPLVTPASPAVAPLVGRVWLRRAEAYRRMRQWERALKDCHTAISLFPTCAVEAHALMGEVMAEARAEAHAAVERMPDAWRRVSGHCEVCGPDGAEAGRFAVPICSFVAPQIVPVDTVAACAHAECVPAHQPCPHTRAIMPPQPTHTHSYAAQLTLARARTSTAIHALARLIAEHYMQRLALERHARCLAHDAAHPSARATPPPLDPQPLSVVLAHLAHADPSLRALQATFPLPMRAAAAESMAVQDAVTAVSPLPDIDGRSATLLTAAGVPRALALLAGLLTRNVPHPLCTRRAATVALSVSEEPEPCGETVLPAACAADYRLLHAALAALIALTERSAAAAAAAVSGGLLEDVHALLRAVLPYCQLLVRAVRGLQPSDDASANRDTPHTQYGTLDADHATLVAHALPLMWLAAAALRLLAAVASYPSLRACLAHRHLTAASEDAGVLMELYTLVCAATRPVREPQGTRAHVSWCALGAQAVATTHVHLLSVLSALAESEGVRTLWCAPLPQLATHLNDVQPPVLDTTASAAYANARAAAVEDRPLPYLLIALPLYVLATVDTVPGVSSDVLPSLCPAPLPAGVLRAQPSLLREVAAGSLRLLACLSRDEATATVLAQDVAAREGSFRKDDKDAVGVCVGNSAARQTSARGMTGLTRDGGAAQVQDQDQDPSDTRLRGQGHKPAQPQGAHVVQEEGPEEGQNRLPETSPDAPTDGSGAGAGVATSIDIRTNTDINAAAASEAASAADAAAAALRALLGRSPLSLLVAVLARQLFGMYTARMHTHTCPDLPCTLASACSSQRVGAPLVPSHVCVAHHPHASALAAVEAVLDVLLHLITLPAAAAALPRYSPIMHLLVWALLPLCPTVTRTSLAAVPLPVSPDADAPLQLVDAPVLVCPSIPSLTLATRALTLLACMCAHTPLRVQFLSHGYLHWLFPLLLAAPLTATHIPVAFAHNAVDHTADAAAWAELCPGMPRREPRDPWDGTHLFSTRGYLPNAPIPESLLPLMHAAATLLTTVLAPMQPSCAPTATLARLLADLDHAQASSGTWLLSCRCSPPLPASFLPARELTLDPRPHATGVELAAACQQLIAQSRYALCCASVEGPDLRPAPVLVDAMRDVFTPAFAHIAAPGTAASPASGVCAGASATAPMTTGSPSVPSTPASASASGDTRIPEMSALTCLRALAVLLSSPTHIARIDPAAVPVRTLASLCVAAETAEHILCALHHSLDVLVREHDMRALASASVDVGCDAHSAITTATNSTNSPSGAAAITAANTALFSVPDLAAARSPQQLWYSQSLRSLLHTCFQSGYVPLVTNMAQAFKSVLAQVPAAASLMDEALVQQCITILTAGETDARSQVATMLAHAAMIDRSVMQRVRDLHSPPRASATHGTHGAPRPATNTGTGTGAGMGTGMGERGPTLTTTIATATGTTTASTTRGVSSGSTGRTANTGSSTAGRGSTAAATTSAPKKTSRRR